MPSSRVHHAIAGTAAGLSCAALLAWPQTAAADKGSKDGSGQDQVSVYQGDNQGGHGGGDNQRQGDNQGGQRSGNQQSNDGGGTGKPAKQDGVSKAHGSEAQEPAPVHSPPHPRPPVGVHRAAAPAAPAATAGGEVLSAATTAPDPAPFSPSADLSRLAAQPVESLGSLTGISFGSGVVLWPVLVVLDLIGFALIVRGQLRRRRAVAED